MSQLLAGRPGVGFDLETTGADPWEARIVTAALSDPAGSLHTWLADPGIEIPTAAQAVHGISTEHAREHGLPAVEVVRGLSAALADLWRSGAVVVIYNAAYDLTVLEAELSRHGLPELQIGTVIDPLVIWRQAERYRKGKKRLSDAVERFGVRVDAAHDAADDARVAVEVAQALTSLVDWTAWTDDVALQTQRKWTAEWAQEFASWLRDRGGDWQSVRGGWPVAERAPGL